MRARDLKRALADNPDLKASERVAETSRLAQRFERDWHVLGGLPYVKELRFAPPRRWAFDYAWPALMVALEIEGGVYSGGRHTRGRGFVADCEKYNSAALRGWVVLRLATGFRLAQVEEIATWLKHKGKATGVR